MAVLAKLSMELQVKQLSKSEEEEEGIRLSLWQHNFILSYLIFCKPWLSRLIYQTLMQAAAISATQVCKASTWSILIVSIDYIPNELPNQGYVTRHYPLPTSKRVSSHSLYITIEQIKVSANDLN